MSGPGPETGRFSAEDLIGLWAQLDGTGIHPADRDFLPAGSFATDLHPVPWVGPLRNARAYLLFLNPGLTPEDGPYEERRPDFAGMLRANLRGEAPYVYLLDQFRDHPGHTWARTTFGTDVTARDSERICVVQLVPYHSERGETARAVAPRLPTSIAVRRFVRETLIPRAQGREIALVVARSQKLWGIDEAEEVGSVVIYRRSECRRAFQTPGSRGGKAIRSFGIGQS